MRQKTSFFNKTLFLKNSARFWPLWAMYLGIWLLTGPLVVSSGIRWNRENPMASVLPFLNSASGTGVVMVLITGAVFALAVFSFLYSSKSANMMASLPITRGTVYSTSYLTGLIWMLGANVLVFLCGILVLSAHGVLDMRILLSWLGIISLEGVFFYSFACFCAMLTGSGFVMPIVYFVLNFAVVIYEMLVRTVLSVLLYGASEIISGITLDKFAPAVAMMEKHCDIIDPATGSSVYMWETIPKNYLVSYNGWVLIAVYAAVGVIFALLGYALYKRRRMETASDVVSVNFLKPVFKYCMGIGGALCSCLLLYYMFFNDGIRPASAWIYMVACAIPGAFIGWYAAEMLVRKSFKVFRHWQGFVICAVLVSAFILCAEMDVCGYEKQVPEAQDVKSVRINTFSQSELESPENIESVLALHRSIIDNKRIHEDEYYREQKGNEPSNWSSVPVTLRYELTDGTHMERVYRLLISRETLSDPGSDLKTLESVVNSQEALNSRYALGCEEDSVVSADVYYYDNVYGDTDRNLDVEQARQLFRAVKQDVEAGNVGLESYELGSGTVSNFNCDINIGITGKSRDVGDRPAVPAPTGETAAAEYVEYIYVPVSEDSVNTLSFLRDTLGIKMAVADGADNASQTENSAAETSEG